MTTNLQVGLRERQQNLEVVISPTKKRKTSVEKGLTSKSINVPSTTVAPSYTSTIKQFDAETIPSHFMEKLMVILGDLHNHLLLWQEMYLAKQS